MPSLPWNRLQTETILIVCKDLGAAPATTNPNRDGMVAFLKNIETRECKCKYQLENSNSTRLNNVPSAYHAVKFGGPDRHGKGRGREVSAELDFTSRKTFISLGQT